MKYLMRFIDQFSDAEYNKKQWIWGKFKIFYLFATLPSLRSFKINRDCRVMSVLPVHRGLAVE